MGCGASNTAHQQDGDVPAVFPANDAADDNVKPAEEVKPEPETGEAAPVADEPPAPAAEQKDAPADDANAKNAAPIEDATVESTDTASSAPVAGSADLAATATGVTMTVVDGSMDAAPADDTLAASSAPADPVDAIVDAAYPEPSAPPADEVVPAGADASATTDVVAAEASSATVEAQVEAQVEVAAPVADIATAPVATTDATSVAKPQAVFVLGGPGAGKGTQCASIVSSFGWVHLSAGDLLRAERTSGGPHAALIEEFIIQGQIVPAELTVSLLDAAMDAHVAAGRTQFLVDGFPRDLDNLHGWKKIVGAKVDLLFVLFFDCTEATMKERLTQRGLSSGRSDDNEEAITKRFATYTKSSRPIIERYESTGRAIKIDANQDTTQVWEAVQAVFKPIDKHFKPLKKTNATTTAETTETTTVASTDA